MSADIMSPVRADITDCPSIADEKFSTVITAVFIPDGSFVPAGGESKTICSSDVSLVEKLRRTRSDGGNWL